MNPLPAFAISARVSREACQHHKADPIARHDASHSAEARLSHWLLRARDLCDGERLPPTREMPARTSGVQRNAASILAHALQQAGIIHYNLGYIGIDDPQGLEDTSCEGYRVVKARQDRLLKLPAATTGLPAHRQASDRDPVVSPMPRRSAAQSNDAPLR